MSLIKHPLMLTAALSGTMLAACANADTANETTEQADTAVTAQAKLAGSPRESWLNLSGTVESAGPRSFVLDYGSGNVTVEMDDWDWYREGRAIDRGDAVVVTGKIDDGLYQDRKIEASSVYVKDLNTFFYANGADEEDVVLSRVYVTTAPSYSDSTGYVTAVEGREFTLGAVNGAIRVDTTGMTENPMDQTGFQQIEVGDRVYVWGDLDLGARESTELMAKGIVTLHEDSTASS